MPSYKRSRYAAVNERRRKREFNRRSTGQLQRLRREREADLNASNDRITNPRGRKRHHGLVNQGYLASLMAQRDIILREAGVPLSEQEEVKLQRARERAEAQGLVSVEEHVRETPRGETISVVEHVRAPPPRAGPTAAERSHAELTEAGDRLFHDENYLPPVAAGTVVPDGAGGWLAGTAAGTRRFTYKSQAEEALRVL